MMQYQSSLSAINYPVILIIRREWRSEIIDQLCHWPKINDTGNGSRTMIQALTVNSEKGVEIIHLLSTDTNQ